VLSKTPVARDQPNQISNSGVLDHDRRWGELQDGMGYVITEEDTLKTRLLGSIHGVLEHASMIWDARGFQNVTGSIVC
jgi:hypothetical protein